jgi:hypothetical protein
MASNYPPGVTGSEFQIAGPDREWEVERWCETCQASTSQVGQSYRHESWFWCSVCENTEDGPDDREPDDPDRVRDLREDAREWGGMEWPGG